MNSSTTLLETSFMVSALPDEFTDLIHRTGRDDFGRTVQILVASGGEPVRDQLRRVAPGERIILCSYQAVPLPSAFAEIGPVYVCAESGASDTRWRDELPPGYFTRTFALRAYNAADEIIDSTLVEPAAAPALIRRWLARPEVSHLHARFAGHGCFACRFDRSP
jgi:hypothetical protein